MMTPAEQYISKFLTGESLFTRWSDDVNNGVGPVVYEHTLPAPAISPGNIALIGGAPGAGKTALVMQATVEALRHTDSLRALVANVEMSPTALLDRQLARICGVEAEVIRHRRFDARHRERLPMGIEVIRGLIDRLAFLEPPFDLENITHAAEAHRADVVVLDYVQRLTPRVVSDDGRVRVNAMMHWLRKLAAEGVAVLAVAALGRSRDNKGRSSYSSEALGLASFRESSELEYGADDAFILAPKSADAPDYVQMSHLKCRHGAQRSLDLRFDRARQSFTVLEDARAGLPTGGGSRPIPIDPKLLASRWKGAAAREGGPER